MKNAFVKGDRVLVVDPDHEYHNFVGIVEHYGHTNEHYLGYLVTFSHALSEWFKYSQLNLMNNKKTKCTVGDTVQVSDTKDSRYGCSGLVCWTETESTVDSIVTRWAGVSLYGGQQIYKFNENQLEIIQIVSSDDAKYNDKKAKYKVGDKVVIKATGETGTVTNDKNFRGLYYIETDYGVVYTLFEGQLSPDQSDSKGQQSHLDERFDLVPPIALKTVAKVLGEGETKYPAIDGVPNWHYIPTSDHLNHALAHIYAYLRGVDTGEDDLAHAATRLLLALEIDRIGVKKK